MASLSLYSVLSDPKLLEGDGYEVLSKAIRKAIRDCLSPSQLQDDPSWDQDDLASQVVLKILRSKPLTKSYEEPKHAENASKRWLEIVVKNEAHRFWKRNGSKKRQHEADTRHTEFLDDQHSLEIESRQEQRKLGKQAAKARADRVRRMKKKAAEMLGIESYLDLTESDLRRLQRLRKGEGQP